MSVKSKPFLTDFLWTWFGRVAKPTYSFSWKIGLHWLHLIIQCWYYHIHFHSKTTVQYAKNGHQQAASRDSWRDKNESKRPTPNLHSQPDVYHTRYITRAIPEFLPCFIVLRKSVRERSCLKASQSIFTILHNLSYYIKPLCSHIQSLCLVCITNMQNLPCLLVHFISESSRVCKSVGKEWFYLLCRTEWN